MKPWLFVLAGLALLLPAQQRSAAPAAGAPRFDVVSIRVNNTGHRGGAWDDNCESGRWSGKNVPVSELVSSAYDIDLSQIAGIPAWDDKPLHQYDVVATCPGGVPVSQTAAMLQAMLADRFGLAAHWETRDMQVRTLTVAPGGVKLAPPGACVPPREGPELPAGTPVCGDIEAKRTGPNGEGYPRPGFMMTVRWQGWSVTMADFVKYFGWFGRLGQPPMVDETGLTGRYDFQMQYQEVLNLKDENGKPVNQSYKLYAAMKDQLGLIFNQDKLSEHAMPVLVIDHIAPATAN